jgi:2-hydroxy-6-oxonona-2,4-dienedioate hydrolase
VSRPSRALWGAAWGAVASLLFIAVLLVWWRFDRDIAEAGARAGRGSALLATRCGPIEYQQAGSGTPLLVIHGAGGGHDQGMAFARSFTSHGVRVIAVSRFGYLRTPMRADASPEAQADAHVCVLDAQGIDKAAILGFSAGGPSALQMAIRHPDRVAALALVVPLAYRPPVTAGSVAPPSALAEKILDSLVGSDFLFWSGLHVARGQAIQRVLATPPALVANASAEERAQVNAMLDDILPLSARAEGLRNESIVAKSLVPYDLSAIRAPTLIISAKDDGYGTFAMAQYTASQIGGAKFIGYERGGHLLVGHDEEVRREIMQLLATHAATTRKTP